MAATASFGSLAVPQPEDSMDMSSPGQHDHEDIDIDFDDFNGGAGLTDDTMQDDGDQADTLVGAADADMEDGLPRSLETVLEAEMSDHIHDSNYNDDGNDNMADEDELIDYDDEEWALHEEYPDVAAPSEPEHKEADNTEHVSSAIEDAKASTSDFQEGTDKAETVASPVNDEKKTDPDVQSADNRNSHEDENLAAQQTDDGPTLVSDTTSANLAPLVPSTNSKSDPEEPIVSQSGNRDFSTGQEQENSKVVDLEVAEITASGDVEPDAISAPFPGSPTDTGLHPVILRYGSEEFHLFKSKHQLDGLLEDDNLCNVSFSELIGHCKGCLAELKDQTISSSDKEAVLSFDSLPLVMLAETSRAAFEQSLNDVLNVFLQLHHNDGATDIPPLVLTLSLQYRFTSSLDLFKHMAEAGQGYTEIPGIPLFDESQEEEDGVWTEYNEDVENDQNDAEEDEHEDYNHEYEEAHDSESTSQEVAAAESGVVSKLDSGETTLGATLEENSSATHEIGKEVGIEDAQGKAGQSETADKQDSQDGRSEGQTRNGAEDEVAVQDDNISLALGDEDDAKSTRITAKVSPHLDQLSKQTEVNDVTQPLEVSKPLDVNDHPLESQPLLTTDQDEDTPNSSGNDPTINDRNTSVAAQISLTDGGDSAQDYIKSSSRDKDAIDTLGEGHDLVEAEEPSGLDEQHDDIPFDLEAQADFQPSDIFDGDHSQEPYDSGLENEVETKSNAAGRTDEFDEDTIDFDDDTTEQHEARVQAQSTVAGHESPTTKRTFSDHADEDDLLDFEDEPETKKARAL